MNINERIALLEDRLNFLSDTLIRGGCDERHWDECAEELRRARAERDAAMKGESHD